MRQVKIIEYWVHFKNGNLWCLEGGEWRWAKKMAAEPSSSVCRVERVEVYGNYIDGVTGREYAPPLFDRRDGHQCEGAHAGDSVGKYYQ